MVSIVKEKVSLPTYAIGTLILLLPILKGGMLSWMNTALSLFLILILFSVSSFTNKSKIDGDSAWIYIPLAYTLLLVLELFVTPHLVNWNSPHENLFGVSLANQPINTVAILQSATLFYCYWSICWLASKLNKFEFLCLSICFIVAGLFQATYALVAVLSDSQSILGIWPREHYGGQATGTFVNHNHMPNYLALVLPYICFALITLFKPEKKSISALVTLLAILLIYGFFLSATIMSQSRMGTIIVCLTCVSCLFIFTPIKSAYFRFGLVLFLIGILVFIIATMSGQLGLEHLARRFERLLGYESRVTIWSSLLQLPLSMYILGAGAGSFLDVSIAHHSPLLPKTAYYAHNDFWQFLIEYGLLGTIILLIGFYRWLRAVGIKSWSLSQHAAMISILAISIHALVDFPFHIPANAFVFWFSLGILVNPYLKKEVSVEAASQSKRTRVRTRSQTKSRRRRVKQHR